MGGDAGEDVGEPGLWIHAVHLRRDDQAVHSRGAVAAAVGTAEQPAFSAKGRQVNSCCGVAPCRRATCETTASGTSDSSIARAFSSSDQRRRPARAGDYLDATRRRRLRVKRKIKSRHKPISKSGNQTRRSQPQNEGVGGTPLTGAVVVNAVIGLRSGEDGGKGGVVEKLRDFHRIVLSWLSVSASCDMKAIIRCEKCQL